MDRDQRNNMLREAELQLQALKTIRKWLAIGIGLSTAGAGVIYFGFASQPQHIVVGFIGILLTVISLLCALIINYGMRNGQRNVRKILDLAG